MSLSDAVDAIRLARHIAIVGHETPDADCLGSMGGLCVAMRDIGKAPRLCLPGGLSRKLTYLMRIGELRPATTDELRGIELAVVVDTAREKRANFDGKWEALSAVPVLNIDHHATNTRFGRWNWVDASRSSASEMIYELVVALGVSVTPSIATLLYSGIHSDTRGFSLSNTTPRSLEAAHDLARAGASIAEACERLNRSVTKAEFALLQRIYANTRISDDGLIAWSMASYDEIAATGCDADAIDDQVEVPRSLDGVRIAILFTEGDPGVVRMNFRGEGGFSVLPLAEHFGGGGHHVAAGARQRGSLGAIVEEVLAAAQRFVAT